MPGFSRTEVGQRDGGMNPIRIVNLKPEYARALAALQPICFPHLDKSEWMTEAHFRHHSCIFPDGNYVALAGERVVGLGAGFFIDFDLDHPQHRYLEMVAGGSFAHHDPNGAYYYDADVSVHPDYRGRGIGTRIYAARQQLVRRYGKKGMIAGSLLPGYGIYKGQMSVADYVDGVVRRELRDPTLTFHLNNGFEVRTILEDYVTDPATDNRAALIVWSNPDAQ